MPAVPCLRESGMALTTSSRMLLSASDLRKNLRIHDHDVRHGHESRQTREQFAARGGLVFLQVKNAFDQAESLPVS